MIIIVGNQFMCRNCYKIPNTPISSYYVSNIAKRNYGLSIPWRKTVI